MRLAGQVRGGYYAAPPPAIAELARRLQPTGRPHVLDPCAGHGHALKQLAEALGAEPWGVELADDRGAALTAALPEGHALAPADFLGCSISVESFGLVWCNPPFDFAGGGMGRVESHFIEAVLPLIARDGILALCCPEPVAQRYEIADWLERHFDNLSAFPFPEDCREYREVIVLGRKRREEYDDGESWNLWGRIFGHEASYVVPEGRQPPAWRKTEPTDGEILGLLAGSRNRLAQFAGRDAEPVRPPLSPAKGHQAMILASGLLNGLVHPEDEPPHVIHGTVRKQRYLVGQTVDEDSKGEVTTRTTYGERIELVLRTLDGEGNLVTLTSGGE